MLHTAPSCEHTDQAAQTQLQHPGFGSEPAVARPPGTVLSLTPFQEHSPFLLQGSTQTPFPRLHALFTAPTRGQTRPPLPLSCPSVSRVGQESLRLPTGDSTVPRASGSLTAVRCQPTSKRQAVGMRLVSVRSQGSSSPRRRRLCPQEAAPPLLSGPPIPSYHNWDASSLHALLCPQAAELVAENCEAYEAHMQGVRDYLEERLVVSARARSPNRTGPDPRGSWTRDQNIPGTRHLMLL